MRRTAWALLQLSLLTLVVSTNANIWTFFNPVSLKQDTNQNQQFLLSTSPAYPPAEAPSLHHHHHHKAHHPDPLSHPPLTQTYPPAKSPMMPPPGHHHHHHSPLPHTPLTQPHPPAKSPMMPPPGHHHHHSPLPHTPLTQPHPPAKSPMMPPPGHHHHHHSPLPHTPLTQPHPPAMSPMMPPPGHHHHHHKHQMPPMMAPSHPPMAMPPMTMPPHSPHGKPSMKPPTQAPGHQPVKAPPRMLVAVQGVVYCKSCNSSGVATLLGASPLEGARVVMKCRNTVYTTKVIVVTDKNGYFMIKPPKTVTNYGVHKCRVALASPPLKSPCKKPTMLNDGLLGSVPVPQIGSKKNESSHHDFAMYKVGPFAYEHLNGHCPPKQ